MSDRLLPHSVRMAGDWPGWVASLPHDVRAAVEDHLRQAPDPEEEKAEMTGVRWLVEQSGRPADEVALHVRGERRDFAEQVGWGDAWRSTQSFFRRIVTEAAAIAAERRMTHGLQDEEAPVITVPGPPVPAVDDYREAAGRYSSPPSRPPLMVPGPVVKKPDLETARRSRKESLLSRAFLSATEEIDLSSEEKSLRDMAGDYVRWQQQYRGTPAWRPGREDYYWSQWMHAWRAGAEEKRAAIAAAQRMQADMVAAGDTGGEESLEKAVDVFQALSPCGAG